MIKAIRLLKKNGVPIGLPMPRGDGAMIFPVNESTITADQVLELFDRRELNAAAVRKIARDSSSQSY